MTNSKPTNDDETAQSKCPECGDPPHPELLPPENDAPLNADGDVWHWGCWMKERTRQHARVCALQGCRGE